MISTGLTERFGIRHAIRAAIENVQTVRAEGMNIPMAKRPLKHS